MNTKLIPFLLLLLLMGLFNCKPAQPKQTLTSEIGLFKVVILYPSGDDKTFDMDYYEKKHMPMVAGFLGKNLRYYEIDKGIAGRTTNDKPPFVTIGYFFINDIAAYNQSIAQNRDTIVNDLKKYTNIQPIIQFSQIKQLEYPNKK